MDAEYKEIRGKPRMLHSDAFDFPVVSVSFQFNFIHHLLFIGYAYVFTISFRKQIQPHSF